MGKSLDQQVIEELKPGEKLLWHGRPASRRRKQRKTEAPIKLLLLLGGFLAVIGGVAVAAGNPGTVACLVLGFVVAVVNTIRERRSSPYRLARTMYVLTDRRVFALRDYPPGRRVDSIPLQFIGDAAIVDWKPDGRGTMRLGTHDLGGGRKQPEPLRLFVIEGPESTRDLILQARERWIDNLHAAK